VTGDDLIGPQKLFYIILNELYMISDRFQRTFECDNKVPNSSSKALYALLLLEFDVFRLLLRWMDCKIFTNTSMEF
jgi:hypothetical protein